MFPMENKKDPPSLWGEFFPKSRMIWKWDESGDSRISDLWHMRTELSACGEVAYAKWYRGRATFFSLPVFSALLKSLAIPNPALKPLSKTAASMLETLDDDSPRSLRYLKQVVDLQGRYNETAFTRVLKELWTRLLIVGFGEIDDGAFPSLALGSSRLLFEEQWDDAVAMKTERASKILTSLKGADNSFLKFHSRLLRHSLRKA